jgi:signal transduction histidine kinase/CheY-like chemotaxis protein
MDRTARSEAIDHTDRLDTQLEREHLRAESGRDMLAVRAQQSQRLESLGQLAGGVAHDFNNLLGVILNYAAFVNEELQIEIDSDTDAAARWEPVRADVDQIVNAADRAAVLTRQLLAFARREVVRPQVLDLNAIIGEVEQLLVRSLGEHVEMSTSLDADIWPVLVDPGKLEQVLVNLAVNARDAMTSGGTLTFETKNVVADDAYVGLNPGIGVGRYVRLRVSDTGCGMDESVQARAFEPFYTTKAPGEGTGLGLATVYGIITQAGGDVQLSSEIGLGTTITVLLPATDEEAEPRRVVEAPMRSRSGEVVLVVEDEDPLRAVTCRVLTRNGYQVLSAANGPEALEVAAAADQIDLLLTDIVMPQMLGNELAALLTEIRPGLRVVYMSGYAQPVLTSSGGIDPDLVLVEKPFSAQMLLERVGSALAEVSAADLSSEVAREGDA